MSLSNRRGAHSIASHSSNFNKYNPWVTSSLPGIRPTRSYPISLQPQRLIKERCSFDLKRHSPPSSRLSLEDPHHSVMQKYPFCAIGPRGGGLRSTFQPAQEERWKQDAPSLLHTAPLPHSTRMEIKQEIYIYEIKKLAMQKREKEREGRSNGPFAFL